MLVWCATAIFWQALWERALAAAIILGTGYAHCRCLSRRTHEYIRAEITVMQAADVGRAVALNNWCLRICCGCCWGVPQQRMRWQPRCLLRAAATYKISLPFAASQGSVIAAMQAAGVTRAAKGSTPHYWRLRLFCGPCCVTAVWWHVQAPWERAAAATSILGGGGAHCRCPCIGGTIRQQGR